MIKARGRQCVDCGKWVASEGNVGRLKLRCNDDYVKSRRKKMIVYAKEYEKKVKLWLNAKRTKLHWEGTN